MNNKVYLLWLCSPKNKIEKYLDSVWENEKDLDEHVNELIKNELMKDFITITEEKPLYKHI